MERIFHRTAIAEGISSTLLFFVAMPLKYIWGMDKAVTYVGWAHGLLFIAYVVILAICWLKLRWSLKFCTIAFIASLVPAGPFFLHPEQETARRAAS
jgi:integral membrane protein